VSERGIETLRALHSLAFGETPAVDEQSIGSCASPPPATRYPTRLTGQRVRVSTRGDELICVHVNRFQEARPTGPLVTTAGCPEDLRVDREGHLAPFFPYDVAGVTTWTGRRALLGFLIPFGIDVRLIPLVVTIKADQPVPNLRSFSLSI